MTRAPDLGLAGARGPFDAITDVAGVRVGHCTLIEGDAVRTGVTVVLPHDGAIWAEPLYAGCHRLNGNGELTGSEWIRESGLLTSPVALTNTHSVGVVRDALVAWQVAQRSPSEVFWALPVVGETWDGVLNDVNGQHVRAEHVTEAIAAAASGPVAEGNVGSGTGMICHGFKGGIGTASRVAGEFVVGALVQANHGRRTKPPRVSTVSVLADAYMTELFDAAVDSTEEAIVNALLAAETMTGRDGNTAHALDAARLADLLRRHAR